jgi:hypothetical protein
MEAFSIFTLHEDVRFELQQLLLSGQIQQINHHLRKAKIAAVLSSQMGRG